MNDYLKFRGTCIGLGILLIVGGCDFLWPTEAPYDPRRCEPRCKGTEVCFEGNCISGSSDGTVPKPDIKDDLSPAKDAGDGPSRDKLMPDKPRPDQAGDNAVPDVSAPDKTIPDKLVPDAPLPTCADKAKNGGETDVDCGGKACPACADGKKCKLSTDCAGKVCQSGTCASPTCTDKVKNGGETDVDCGGSTCTKCPNTKACKKALDCMSGVCSSGVCVIASCTDKVKNGSETDVDCGGGTCAKCAHTKVCKAGSDCASGSCAGGTCASCGDKKINGADACDGTDLGGKTCKSAGFYTGTVACAKDCKLDTSGCTDCGNGVINSGEKCDGGQFGNQTCKSLGFHKGTLSCKKDCSFDTTKCSNCGNSKLDAGEACDGAALGSKTCMSQGYVKGTLACTGACALDTTGCSNCGNGKIDAGEVCDGTNFGTNTCASLGMSGGTLKCNTSCAHDYAGCTWATTAGGEYDDRGLGVGVDAKGNVYVAGTFQKKVNFGSVQLTANGGTNAFVAKLSPSAKVLWVTAMGNTGMSTEDAAVDAAGNTFITGRFSGTGTFGTYKLTATGNNDLFVARVDATGKVSWAISGGGTSGDTGRGIAVGPSGNCYVTGHFYNTGNFGGKVLTSAGGDDALVASIKGSTGAYNWVVSAGGTGEDEAQDIAVDSSGNSYVVGTYRGTIVLDKSYPSAGWQDVFVAKFDNKGKLVWGGSGGGTGSDWGNSITVNNLGESFIAGYFEGSATFGYKTLTSGGGNDGFVAKIKSTGDFQYAIPISGTGTNSASAIVTDASGNFYVAGSFSNPATFGGKTLTGSYNGDVYVAKVSWTANVLRVTTGGGTRNESPFGIALDVHGNTYVTGHYQSTATFGGTTLTAKGTPGKPDVLLWKIDKNGK